MGDLGHNTGSGSAPRTADRVPLVHEALLEEIGNGWSPEQMNTAVQMLDADQLKFPPGARRLPPGLVSTVERTRLIAAMLQAIAERGWQATTIDNVIARCTLRKPSFYAHFASITELHVVCLEAIVSHVQTRLEIALSGADGRSWRETIRLSLAEILRFVREEPAAAYALIVDARGAPPEVVERRDALLDRITSCLESKIHAERLGDNAPTIAPSGIVGGVASVLFTRLNSGDTDGLDALVPALEYVAMVPYIGRDAALAEASRSSSL